MALTTPYNRIFYVSDGITSIFSFPFIGINRDYIRVNVQHVNGDVDMNVNVDIPRQPNGSLVGNIIFGVDQVPEQNAVIMIERIVPQTQDTPYNTAISFNSSAVDFSFDKLTALVQQLSDRLDTATVGVHPFQETAINLQQVSEANQGQYLLLDFENKLIKGGLFLELTDTGRYRISKDKQNWTYLPKSDEIQELRQRVLTNPTRYIFEYRVGNTWFGVGDNGQNFFVNHNDLEERDADDAHPISSITGLQTALDEKTGKSTDFQTAITEENLGITQAEYKVLDEKIDLAATSGTNIGHFWFGKTKADTVAPNPTTDTQNYYDFTNSTLYKARADLTGWDVDRVITPPTDIDVNIRITAKFWDIPQQDGQQGGTAYWSHLDSDWGYAPILVSFDNTNLTGTPISPDATPESPGNMVANLNAVQAATVNNNNNLGALTEQALVATQTLTMNGARNQVFRLQNVSAPVAAATITMAFGASDPNTLKSFRVHIRTGSVLPTLTWVDSNGKTIKRLDESQLTIVAANKTAIFAVEQIGLPSGDYEVVMNYCGAY